MKLNSIIKPLAIALCLCSLVACGYEGSAPSSSSKDSQTNSSSGSGGLIKGTGSSASPTGANGSPGSTSSSLSPAAGTEINSSCTSDDPEDRQWCARLKLARMGEQPTHVAVGEIPADPNVSHIFASPIIFANTQLYIWLSSTTYAIEGYGGGYRNKQTFYFLPTGRFFYKTVQYYGQVTPQGKVSAIWGAYRFTSESGDQIELETDQGERLVLPMKHGRRNLVWDDTTYGQVDWENEALRRQMGQ